MRGNLKDYPQNADIIHILRWLKTSCPHPHWSLLRFRSPSRQPYPRRRSPRFAAAAAATATDAVPSLAPTARPAWARLQTRLPSSKFPFFPHTLAPTIVLDRYTHRSENTLASSAMPRLGLTPRKPSSTPSITSICPPLHSSPAICGASVTVAFTSW